MKTVGTLAPRPGQGKLTYEAWTVEPDIGGCRWMARCPEKRIETGPCPSEQAAVISLGMQVDIAIEREKREGKQ